ncbi:zinc ribbon domain-containing protein [Volucribacter amazonae]|uniref:UPF0547 domain-containing protein n=1 Tax=Volucribacter amazonae TaxID=256731 RepID=A0A9X4PE06_9PAST|nr:zinc ribbon domain-containing protein [Volucribacter amazonae]MDG6895816.1 hypothetical protein [Volucribacter amazonae]
MALQACPECRKKISSSVAHCPHCGFSFDSANLAKYQQLMEQRRLQNAEINKKSTKLHLIWLVIFAVILLFMGWWHN